MMIAREPNIWRLQTKTDSEDSKTIADYCLDNNVIAIGWSLQDKTLDERTMSENEKDALKKERDSISNFKEYERIYKKFYNSKISLQIYKLHDEIKVNDLIWMRYSGKYYLGRVGVNSKWEYCSEKNIIARDASNQRTDIEWIEIGGEADVPGGVTTAFIRGRPIQHIWKDGIKEYSMYIYNKRCVGDKYKLPKKIVTNTKAVFYNYISPTGCEDLVCMYLYKKCGYICIPSTNKKATELYECVLLNPDNGERIYIQVKCGKCNLDARNYKDLNGKSYLFTAEGKIENLNDVKDKNVEIINSDELFLFAFDKANKNILPENILTWCGVISEIQSI